MRNNIKPFARRKVGKMLRRTRTRKLAIWSALPPYLGGKRRLCGLIFREVDRILPRRHWPRMTFLDGFLGGGSVSLYAKAQGFRVVATDIAERSIAVGKALIENSRVRLTHEDILRVAAPAEGPPGRIEQGYAPSTFTRAQARLLDRILAVAAETPDEAKGALFRLVAIRVALLAHPMSQVRPGTIHRLSTGEYESITESCLYHYVDGLRLTRPEKLWELARQINAGVFEGHARIVKANIIDELPRLDADVAYLDPPYCSVMAYEREYKVIDEILEGSSRPTSPFTARDGASMLDILFERAQHIPVWLLSYGNAVNEIEEIEAKMSRFGRSTRAIALRYQHLPAVATEEKKRDNREFLVVGWDPDAPLLRSALLPKGGIATERVLDHLVTGVEMDPAEVDSELAASPGGIVDLPEDRPSCLTEELSPNGGGLVPEAESRPDAPETVFAKTIPDDGSERRVVGLGCHSNEYPIRLSGGQAEGRDAR